LPVKINAPISETPCIVKCCMFFLNFISFFFLSKFFFTLSLHAVVLSLCPFCQRSPFIIILPFSHLFLLSSCYSSNFQKTEQHLEPGKQISSRSVPDKKPSRRTFGLGPRDNLIRASLTHSPLRAPDRLAIFMQSFMFIAGAANCIRSAFKSIIPEAPLRRALTFRWWQRATPTTCWIRG
jgi:hypothetical protein